ncbi:hypothetical protein D5274_09440 [bacterium 1XD42-94]|nr:hypothetical protein [bacterium 1XD42-76]NBK05359.1 hypothetical protein [bacterium 1XD42-94]
MHSRYKARNARKGLQAGLISEICDKLRIYETMILNCTNYTRIFIDGFKNLCYITNVMKCKGN